MAEVEVRDTLSKPAVSNLYSLISHTVWTFSVFVNVAPDDNVKPLVMIEGFWLAVGLVPTHPTYYK
jgi:hypothetical protein